MTKHIYKGSILAILASTFMYLSCDKTKLDLLPTGPTEANYFANEADFNRSVIGVYAKLTDFYGYNGGSSIIGTFLLPGDDITTNASNEDVEIFASLQPSSGKPSFLWNRLYQLIARANVVIEKIDVIGNDIYTTPNLKDHQGEALFLRGFAHYYLWNYFGTAPIRTARVIAEDDFRPSNSSGTELLDQAIADFTEAANLLPDTWSTGNRGRVTKNSANGFLGKSLVFRASVGQNAADYTAAITAFNKITGASLIPSFGDNFSGSTENNLESLFEVQAGNASSGNNVWLDNDFDNNIGDLSIFWGYYSNNFALFGQSPYFVTSKLVDAIDEDDPRVTETFDPGSRSVNKYVLRDAGGDVGSFNNYRVLRLADIKLLEAEAILQSGGSTSDVIALINEVRTRARNMVPGGTFPQDYSANETNRTTIMDWIIKERLIELAGEGQRWLDLKRWHVQGIINLNNSFFSSNVPVSFEVPKHLLLPIPTSELDVNPNMSQNVGY
jgi:hypothetical protein